MKYIKTFNTTAELEAYINAATPGYYLLRDLSKPVNQQIVRERVDGLPHFCMTFLESGTLTWRRDTFQTAYQYNLNNTSWVNYTDNTPITVSAGDKLYWRNIGNPSIWQAGSAQRCCGDRMIYSTARFKVSGHLCSLERNDTAYTDEDNYTSISSYSTLFTGEPKLVDAKYLIFPKKIRQLDATVGSRWIEALPGMWGFVDDMMYFRFFEGCTGLVRGPEYVGPTTYNVTLDTAHPRLPFVGGFYKGCTSLTEIGLFRTTEILPGFFSDNSTISFCDGCTSLQTVPTNLLPWTNLYEDCYQNLFYNCTSLTTAPELPATTLTKECYYQMFQGCTSLTTAPELPATTLADDCYSSMFSGCTSLTTAPELPATTLADDCYSYMFYDCSSLNYVKIGATDISATNCLQGWMANVSNSGDFYRKNDVTYPSGSSGKPNNWTDHTY